MSPNGTSGPCSETASRATATSYAAGVDKKDPELLLSAFHPDGRLSDPYNDATQVGHDQIRGVLGMLAKFVTTYHIVGNTRYDIDGDTATGEAYCLAHKILPDAQAIVGAVRYQDKYSRRNGEWRLDDRTVIIDWTRTDTVSLNAAGTEIVGA
ncbi:nuclear transport factor 2 family protein [Streptomyces sp. NBS 14/10]|uniref:nuclear transport factor 2 family protein n=1 Tax=Streptomyces sp. NBS 14/10 TaxID=1945643 RepID=UPI0011800DE0|nr:nuclear transport factor 2 family protein [Streptomyces sp. NBS 14/10]KAK1180958.1 nuclear transport factor 2 family protein [Streptomyces sp. NBS 14/10]